MRRYQAETQAAVARQVNGNGAPFSTKELETEDVPAARIAKWRDGTKEPRVREVRDCARKMKRKPEEMLAALYDIYGLAELGVKPLELMPSSRPEQALPGEALDVGAAAGRLAEVVQRVTADRFVSPDEGEEVAAAGRAVVLEAAQVQTLGEQASLAGQPRLALAGAAA